MRIGIDIDDTLVNTSDSFDEIVKKYNINFSKKFKDNWTEDEMKFIFTNYLKETLVNAKLKENAKEVLEYLSSLGHELIVITARTEAHCSGIEVFTKKFMKENDIKINEFYFGEYKKSEIAKKIKIDVMIDDNYDVYNNMIIDGIDCILYGDKIKNWKDVLEYIKEKEE